MDPLEHIVRATKDLHLTDVERVSLRRQLLAHMEEHPALTPSPYLSFFFMHPALRSGAFALALVLMVGGGSALAAEGSLPGEILYPLKVNVVEPAIGALQFSAKAQADWQVNLIDRRLVETDELKAEENLDTSGAVERVTEAFIRAEQKVKALKKEDAGAAAEVTANFAATLEKHEDTFVELETPTVRKAMPAVPDTSAESFSTFSAMFEAPVSATSTEDGKDDKDDSEDEDSHEESIKKFRGRLHLEDELELEIEKD